MAFSAKELRKSIMADCGGKRPRTMTELRKTRSYRHLNEACGLDEDGLPVPDKHSQVSLGKGANDFRLRDLFEQLCVYKDSGEPVGSEFVQENLIPNTAEPIWESGGAMDAVDSSMFMGVTGQLLITKILERFQAEEFVATAKIPTFPSPLMQERWPGIGMPKDPGKNVLRVGENKPYPTVGFGEEYVETPLTIKEGLIIPVSKEAIYFDRTALVTKRAEKEALGCMIGGTTDPVLFTEKRAFDSAPVSLDAYQSVTGLGDYAATAAAGLYTHQLATNQATRAYPFVNEVPNLPLVDYTTLRTAIKYFDNIVDPNTGEPIVVGKPFVFATENRKLDLYQVFKAESLAKITVQGVNTAGSILTIGPNPVKEVGPYDYTTSRQLRAQMVAQLGVTGDQADQIWFHGDIGEAIQYVENWPITVVQAPANSEAEFTQDIVLRWKASRRGRYAWQNPRVFQRCNFVSQSSGV